MNPTSEQLETYFQTEKEFQLFQELGGIEHDKMMADIKIEQLESAIRKFLNYARTGNSVNTYVPNWQIEELAESLNPVQMPPQDLPRTNPCPSPPKNQELPILDSRTEF